MIQNCGQNAKSNENLSIFKMFGIFWNVEGLNFYISKEDKNDENSNVKKWIF